MPSRFRRDAIATVIAVNSISGQPLTAGLLYRPVYSWAAKTGA
jgi:hypothetical protein